MFLPGMYFRGKASGIARRHQHLAQAICNFRAKTGLLPYELEDLAAHDQSPIPSNVHYRHGTLYIRAGVPRVSYIFGDDFEGWTCQFGRLSIPAVKPTVDSASGEQRVSAALAEYDRRIRVYKNDQWHRSYKMALLAALDRNTDVYDECEDAAKVHPDWWRAQFGIAQYASKERAEIAEKRFRQWVESSPGFVHYWYLAKYYRNLGRSNDAVLALTEAARYPLEQIDDDETWVPHAFAFDAATFACTQKQPDLVLAITDAWSKPRGVYDYQSRDLPAFRAAALLGLGRFQAAKAEVHKVLGMRGIWAGNLDSLEAAINTKDKMFVYDPGLPYEGFFDWSPFPEPEFGRVTE